MGAGGQFEDGIFWDTKNDDLPPCGIVGMVGIGGKRPPPCATAASPANAPRLKPPDEGGGWGDPPPGWGEPPPPWYGGCCLMGATGGGGVAMEPPIGRPVRASSIVGMAI